MIPVINTKKSLYLLRVLALLPLALLLFNFTLVGDMENQSNAAIKEAQVESVDPAVVEKAIAPYLKALVDNPNDEESLAFLNKTLVGLTYKYPEEKAGLADTVKDLIKKYKAPVTTEIDGTTASIRAIVVKE